MEPPGPSHSAAPTAAVVIERPSSVSPVPVPPNLRQILTPSQREVALLERQDRLKMKRKVLAAKQRMDQLDEQVKEVVRVRTQKKAKLSRPAGLPDKMGIRMPAGALKAIKGEKQKAEEAREKRLQELMKICLTILRQMMQHKWAWPFMEPVDAVAMNLPDYHEVIKKPMDLGTIKDKLDKKDGHSYRTPEEVAADVRLVFSNAMTYNQPGTDVHIMAEELNKKFNERWRALMEHKLAEEHARRKQEDADFKNRESAIIAAAEETAAEKLAADAEKQAQELERELDALKQEAAEKCRDMTIEEKRELGANLGKLPSEKLQRVVDIIIADSPVEEEEEEDVEVDLDVLPPSTLWKLYRYVSRCMHPEPAARTNSATTADSRSIGAVPVGGPPRGPPSGGHPARSLSPVVMEKT
ncbi:Transcription initiation factor TFIID [Klebsormidium nitens]|uniref:Transcription initiation factor TFIID n=1 Tax=Klebsormidium nitens TaxID=105231 RepID=A0A1Y1I4P9_KLENI|nr:Transcription initiation factor TFIID [Klebsormidium nitens]|eukprot:GAQ85915.1 Transcription initiation factor TFIID [Klebsormidium nitens]